MAQSSTSAQSTEQGKPRLGELEPCFKHIDEMTALADVGTLFVFGEGNRPPAGSRPLLCSDGVELILGQIHSAVPLLLLGIQLGNILLQLQHLFVGSGPLAQSSAWALERRRFSARAFGLRGARCVEQRQVDPYAHVEVVVLKTKVIFVVIVELGVAVVFQSKAEGGVIILP